MASNYNLQIISKEIIKPSSPTPSQLKTFKLTVIDQFTPSRYIPFAFFFTAPNKTTSTDDILSHLKTSLSDTLVKYYPFAGRLANNGTIIDCNDEGILFFQDKIDCELHEMLKEPEDEITDQLFASGFLRSVRSKDSSLLAVQLTKFKCGGITLSMCVSHKITDGFGTATFIKDWAKVSRGESISPHFIAMSMPPISEISVQEREIEDVSFVTKRFMFSSSGLAHLKAEVASSGSKVPTRVESVIALLFKTATSTARSQSGQSRMSFIHPSVNMRAKLCELPFSETSIGNFAWGFTISAGTESEPKLNELTAQFREGLTNLTTANGERLRFNDWISKISKTVKYWHMPLGRDIDNYRCNSFCRFPFYEVDYGWGKPLWVKFGRIVGSKNSFGLMDSRDGQGIEALVSLGEDHMEIFKHDKELLKYASLNPSVI